MIDNMYL